MRKYYFLCPDCGELQTHMIETWEEVTEYRVKAGEEHEKNRYTRIKTTDSELCSVECENCGFLTNSYAADDFIVVMEGNTIVDVGEYWEEFIDDLKEIAREKGWEVKV